ncbi:MAG: TonB family protein [Persicimonas sp.]
MRDHVQPTDEYARPTAPAQPPGLQKSPPRSRGDTLFVALLWVDQIVSVNAFPHRPQVRIGPDRNNDFVVDDASFGDRASFPFIGTRGGKQFLHFTQTMSGHVFDGQAHYSLEEAIAQGVARQSTSVPAAYEVALNSSASARIEVGPATLLVHFSDMPAVAGPGFGIDTEPLPYLGISAVAHLSLLLLALTMPDDAGSLDLDGVDAEDRFASMAMTPRQDDDNPADWLDDSGAENPAEGHKGEEGKAGSEDSQQQDKKMAIEGPPDNTDPQIKKAHDRQVALDAGAVSVVDDVGIHSMWGDGPESIGAAAKTSLGGIDAVESGEASGSGGLGIRDTGRGGPGDSESIGTADVTTKGPDGGERGPLPEADLGETEEKMPSAVVPGPPDVGGSLDEEIIRRVVRQHRRQIAYCYEKELQKDKALEGRVKVHFTIAPGGDVVSATIGESSMNNRAVESCMTNKIRHWVFPAPDEPGLVTVKYPFNFSRQ